MKTMISIWLGSLASAVSLLAGIPTTNVTVLSGAQLKIHGTVSTPGNVENQGTLSGSGTLIANKLESSGTLLPDSGNTTLTVDATLVQTGIYEVSLDTSSSDTLASGAVGLTGASIVFQASGTPTAPSYVLLTYDTIVGTYASVTNLPSGYQIDYAFQGNSVAIVQRSTPYELWAESEGLVAGVNDSMNADPNGDGVVNLLHYGFGSRPLGSSNHHCFIAKEIIEIPFFEGRFLAITASFKNGAFSANPAGPTYTLAVDDLTYTIQGGDGLSGPFNRQIVQLDPPLGNGLPDPKPGYSYQSFVLFEPASATHPRGFARIGVSSP